MGLWPYLPWGMYFHSVVYGVTTFGSPFSAHFTKGQYALGALTVNLQSR